MNMHLIEKINCWLILKNGFILTPTRGEQKNRKTD